MDCPDAREIEQLVLGRLAGSGRAGLIEHLTQCADCRAELMLAISLRLVLPGESRERGCERLDDGALCLLRDGELEGEAYQRALEHLLDCPDCLGELARLDRALSEAEATPREVPERLLERACALGGARPAARPALLERLFGASVWRLSLAAGAATAVLLLTVLLAPSPPAVPDLPDMPELPRVAVPSPEPEPAAPALPERSDTARPEPRPGPDALAQAKRDQNWSEGLDSEKRLALARAALPASTPAPVLTAALAEEGRVREALRTGELAEYLRSFGPHLAESSAMRELRSGALADLASALAACGQAELAGFARDLEARDMPAETVARRLEVLHAAADEALAGKPAMGAAFRAGVLIQAWRIEALAAGYSGRTASTGRAGELRALVESMDLEAEKRDAALKRLAAMEELEATGQDPGQRLLTEIDALDRLLR
ncbi:MAG: hypothetical protein JXR96_27375 [Deltaproteobacteria bacterium]|nr:hypothetical protein [Deltaproteobacteria bacterium]